MKVLFTIWAKVGTQRNTEEHRGTQRNTEQHRTTQNNTETAVFAPAQIR